VSKSSKKRTGKKGTKPFQRKDCKPLKKGKSDKETEPIKTGTKSMSKNIILLII